MCRFSFLLSTDGREKSQKESTIASFLFCQRLYTCIDTYSPSSQSSNPVQSTQSPLITHKSKLQKPTHTHTVHPSRPPPLSLNPPLSPPHKYINKTTKRAPSSAEILSTLRSPYCYQSTFFPLALFPIHRFYWEPRHVTLLASRASRGSIGLKVRFWNVECGVWSEEGGVLIVDC